MSPLKRALADADPSKMRDLSVSSSPESAQHFPRPDGKVEIRGDVELVTPLAGEELVRLSARRGLLFTSEDPAEAVGRLRGQGVLAYDATGALAGMAIEGERLMRRLTDLDLDRLPTAGPFARVTAVVLRDEGERFRVYVPQELGHYVAEAVLDALAGLENV